MKCSLTALVEALRGEFPLETCGNLDQQITDIRDFDGGAQSFRADVLYIARQNELLRYTGPAVRGPVLCISHTSWDLSHSRSTFPALLMVLCGDPGKVYAALSRHLYQEGSLQSEMPEISGAFLRCRSLDALVETGYRYLGNPFAIHDSDGKLLSYTRQAGFRDEAWQSSAFLDEFCDFHAVENADAMELSRRDQIPVTLHPQSGPAQMRMALSSRGQTMGYLTVMALFRPFTRSDTQIIQLLGCFVTLDLLRQTSITRTSVSDAGRLKSFLEAGDTNLPEVPQWLEQQVCPDGTQYCLILLNASPGRQTPFLDVDELLARLDKLFPEDISTRLEAGVVLLLRTELPLRQHPGIASLRESLNPLLVMGVSMPFSNLAVSGHAALRQARTALELGGPLAPGESCYRYEDYAIYAGLRAASERVSLRELLPSGLLPLLDSDTSGESLHTLEVYLSTGGKKARSADLLFIHLNTLKYRIAQLSARLDMDLDDPATLFSLQYALHIVRYLQCFGDTI